jgi:uncharacterized protein
MTIGLVSDTHGFYDPQLAKVLGGSDLIVHAGDVGAEDVINRLRRIAPVHAVRGNVDSASAGLPLTRTLTVDKVVLHALHILPATQSDLERWAESARTGHAIPTLALRLIEAVDPAANVVVFGHSHEPCLVSLAKILWVNPGSAGRKRFSLPRTCARLEVSEGSVVAQIAPLEPHAGQLPATIQVGLVELRQ